MLVVSVEGFNRTFLVLKSITKQLEEARLERFNRTFLVLKLDGAFYDTAGTWVLIAPFWY